jgi:hypothetical protein
MKKQISKLMMIGVATLLLGGIYQATAQLPMCPPLCSVKAESKAKAKTPAAAKENQQKKNKKSKKEAA